MRPVKKSPQMAEKKHKKKKPEEREKDEIFRLFIKEFQEATEKLWSYYPHIADKLDMYISPKKPSRDRERPFYHYLTEREQEFRLNSLRSIIVKFQADGQVSKDEAIKALEDAAALQDHAEAFKDSLLALAQRVLGLSLDAGEKQTISLIRGKAEHHSYVLVRGVTLSLTWDRKLIKIAVNPEEFVQRQKALSLVGCGSDIQSDVAHNHDAYFGDSLHD